ncbi:hypothetical protein [Microbacterium sp. 18062]|uniref:hypothetical protein n=1 Tax=Microbacterium sp. 18062 TaxID=2681410 RepID=UPI00135CB9F0|nr:hypothetical protein [Microbacterium sp. 18062]
MFSGLAGWHILIILGYALVVVVVIVIAALVIRWAVLSALKAHTRWVDQGRQ